MNLLNLFRSKREIQRRKYKIPKERKSVWFAYGRSNDEKLPPNFDENDKFIDYKIGDITPLHLLPDGKFAFYKVVKSSYRRGDWLYDSDGWSYDCVFDHISDNRLPIIV